VLVLDEAVTAPDVSIRAQILNLLADIRERSGVSYAFISHDLAVVHQISDDAIVMSGGRGGGTRSDSAASARAGNGLHQGLASRSTPPGLEAAPKPPLKRPRWAARPSWSLR
jgi:ABC-type dipeptide/oligopeptide/nickel transport system ATPase subunit